MRPAALLLALLLAPLLVITGCAGGPRPGRPVSGVQPTSIGSDTPVDIPDGAADHTGSDRVVVAVTDNAFEDRVVVVDAGTTVVWVNEGRNDHNVRPAEEDRRSGWFREVPKAVLADGGAGSVTFEHAGDFPYFCSFHGTARRGQRGRVIVVAR